MQPRHALLRSAALATLAVLGLTQPAPAQDKDSPSARPAAPGAGPDWVATLGLAQDLYAIGIARGDALTVLAAARLAARVTVTEGIPERMAPDPATLAVLGAMAAAPGGATATVTDSTVRKLAATEPSAAPADAGTTAEAYPAKDGPGATAATMFAKAQELAGNDQALLGLIEDAQAEGARGRPGDVERWLSRLPPGMTDVWELPFRADALAEVAIMGDGGANLDLVLTDADGTVLCQDPGPSDQLYCSWTPLWSGYFYAAVQNTGDTTNSYYLYKN